VKTNIAKYTPQTFAKQASVTSKVMHNMPYPLSVRMSPSKKKKIKRGKGEPMMIHRLRHT